MHLAAARTILTLAKKRRALDGSDYAEFDLIWAEEGDEVEQWNAVADTQGWGDITVRVEEHGDRPWPHFYTYKGQEYQCPNEGDCDDNLLSVLTIAKIVSADAFLYACNDHCGNSEQGFLALSPAQWQSLEAEFGGDTMAYCFTRATGTLEEFSDAYFSEKNRDRHSDDEAPNVPILIESGQSAASPPANGQVPGFLRKHWLPIAFVGFLLAVLAFGK